MSRIIKLVDEINEYYNLNDTLLASDLGITQQTIRGWREGRKPTTPNYNKVKAMYDEMKQEAIDNSIVQRFEALEEKAEKKPYEVEVPEDLDYYYYVDELGKVHSIGEKINYYEFEKVYQRGLVFKTEEEIEKYEKERILLFKLHKWAEEHNGGWTPNWKDFKEEKYTIVYDHDCEKFYVYLNFYYGDLSKLPLFKTEEIAQQFIEEFGDEIIEVLC